MSIFVGQYGLIRKMRNRRYQGIKFYGFRKWKYTRNRNLAKQAWGKY